MSHLAWTTAQMPERLPSMEIMLSNWLRTQYKNILYL